MKATRRELRAENFKRNQLWLKCFNQPACTWHTPSVQLRFECTGKFTNANICARCGWMLACSCSLALACCSSTQQEFQIESHFQIICALIMCCIITKSKLIIFSFSLRFSLSLSSPQWVALNYQSMICDVAEEFTESMFIAIDRT